MIEYTTSKRSKKTSKFKLDGKEYTFTFPKDTLLSRGTFEAGTSDLKQLSVASGQAAWQWMKAGLGAKQWETISKRLDDPDDGLDVDNLMEIMRALREEYEGRPTG